MAEVTNLGVILSNLILELANFSVKWQTVHFWALLVMWSESQALDLAITVETIPEEQVWPHSTITFFRQTDGLRIGPWGLQSAEPWSNSWSLGIFFAKGQPLKPRGLPDLIAWCPFSKSQQLKYFHIVHPCPNGKGEEPRFQRWVQ